MSFRYDEDSLGSVEVPREAYYGAFTARALKQYVVTGHASHPDLRDSFVMIKRSAARANMQTGAIDAKKGDAITRACDEILGGKLTEWFVVDMINSGAGTAFNMNTNEVIANAALRIIGKDLGEYQYLHPNDHVNMSQSSNDTYPTAMHMSILMGSEKLVPELHLLKDSLQSKADQFNKFRKIGRTHLMDALPITLGDEFASYAVAIDKCTKLIQYTAAELYPVALGGTAVGSGANTPDGYRDIVISELADISSLPLVKEPDMRHGLQSRFAAAAFSGALRGLASELGKISNDIRLMASGPMAGLSEIGIPAVHAGSSIMPGKVNPSLAECMNMICYNVMGNDASVSMAAGAGQFELNVMLPGMLKCILESTDMLYRFIPIFRANLIDGLTANEGRLQSDIQRSPVIVTLLAPRIGYQKSAQLYKESLATGKTIRDLVIDMNLMTADEVDDLLS
ncbi:MAG: aspartate ammonia-lyase [Cenarchaeum sp. SB0665_bin_23]|nr:aspartate ammonia-lyase [Cenarchaeum sp. SB0665_bin_23]MYG33735.1 aspartate ammonia-lyase [Cenarchaeum sp. SB0677_bin_16]